jgi:phospholipid-binding lipoprotein MlaA
MKSLLRVCCLAAAVALSGCASTSGTPSPQDPWEGFNRSIFSFNEGLDKAVIKPVAQGYDAVAPDPVKTGVSNFFSNIGDVFIAVNNLLQGKVGDAASDAGRVLVNTTIGILGLIDWASDMGMEKHDEDFGQTFGRWGVGSGPYVVLPFFGPRTLRDTVGLAADLNTDPVAKMHAVPERNTLLTTRVIDTRAGLLPADKVIEGAALDKYSYIRDAYLQRRERLVNDGKAAKVQD